MIISFRCMAMLREPAVCWAEPPVYRFLLFWAETCRTSSEAQCSHSISHHFGCIHSGGKGFHCNGSSSSCPTAAGSLRRCFNSFPASSTSKFVCLDLAASKASLAFIDAANSTLALRFSSHRSPVNCLTNLRSKSFRHTASCPGAHL
uniref:Uncharacterized protein n=1 Tax=Arundo donax TaxID=35708 RepID=A0A0A9FBM5_ARUDO